LNQEGTDDQEISNKIRITKAKRIIACLNGILWNKNMTKKRKFNIHETMLKSVTLYREHSEATEMSAIRRSMRISRREKAGNEKVKQRMGRFDNDRKETTSLIRAKNE